MKKIYILIFSLIGIALSNLIYFPGLKVKSFDELGWFNKEKITYLSMKKNNDNDNEYVELTTEDIQKVLNDFSKMELRKIKRASDAFDSVSKNANESPKYVIDLKENNQDIGTIYFNDTNYIKFYQNTKEEIDIYNIVNNPDLEIHAVFESARNK
ncbi:hypothetical protein GOP56_01425 [Brevibacillus sp. 7WMA2]|uniref:hypothetical protein n=1 Tax=Brevibacillus sp. 7WMA2 TaxID=2683193 RepID=UPI0013A74676|nr:hypothetical protein [Brevibacillus sp. 7WMA2]QIC04374.1 hypothetical protein GOP56_01425 [Brevibacillus sp. 7WMA2]WPS89509.1 hypothetical protein SMD22_11380 [Brevibacillus halotolerans]